jgi:mRNA-degrading endonuclease RelE of RelBE toxin-antitoxin system
VRRGAYRVDYEIDEDASAVIVLRIDHRSTIYRPQ